MDYYLLGTLLVNVLVLGSALATDLGPARKIGRARILRPLPAARCPLPAARCPSLALAAAAGE